jgi:hypothetical protein
MPNLTKVMTGKSTRLSFCHIWEPQSINGSDPKYSVSLIIPKNDTKTIEAIKTAIKTAYDEGAGKLKGNSKSVPALASLKTPLRDGDTDRPDDPAYAGCYFLNANSRTKPQIVDQQVQPILDQSEVYSGCYARATVTFYAYNANGNRGIACGLGNIQKVRDGDRLGGGSTASEDFTAIEDEDNPYGQGGALLS